MDDYEVIPATRLDYGDTIPGKWGVTTTVSIIGITDQDLIRITTADGSTFDLAPCQAVMRIKR